MNRRKIIVTFLVGDDNVVLSVKFIVGSGIFFINKVLLLQPKFEFVLFFRLHWYEGNTRIREMIQFFTSFEMVDGPNHRNFLGPVIPRADNFESLDQQAGTDLDFALLVDWNEHFLGVNLAREANTFTKLFSEPC